MQHGNKFLPLLTKVTFLTGMALFSVVLLTGLLEWIVAGGDRGFGHKLSLDE